jgi:hypothetical protein
LVCKICHSIVSFFQKGTILNRYNISYFYCDNCGFIQTEEPYWLEESYKKSINKSDTGILSRNFYLSKLASIIIYFYFDKGGNFLDFSGGYGIFTRLMRDMGFNFYWYDPYTTNLFSKGFEYTEDLGNLELITLLESMEHFVNPIEEIENLLKLSENIFFTTQLLPHPIPKPNDWWYYGLEHGQHISFYSLKTLNLIANRYGLHFYNYRDIHLFTNKKINKSFFRFLLTANRFGLSSLIKKFMRSKTFNDMILLKSD